MKATVQLVLILLCMAGLVAGCERAQEAKKVGAPASGDVAKPPPPMPNGHPPATVAHHAYTLLLTLDAEPPGYAMYTYVLFGRRVGVDAPPLSHDTAQRYQALLDAIGSSTNTADELLAASIPKDETNLFSIPAVSAAALPSLHNYGSGLAMQYRSMALGTLRDEMKFWEILSHRPGPFLVSVLRPLNHIRSPEPLLFTDLSTHNPAAMREVVAAYKQRINRRVPDKVEAFKSLRLDLLTLILDADDHVTLIKDAVADWRDVLPNP